MNFRSLTNLSPETVGYLKEVGSALNSMVERVGTDIESKLLRALEKHLGHIPTTEEVSRHGHAVTLDDVWKFYWNDQLVLSIKPPLAAG